MKEYLVSNDITVKKAISHMEEYKLKAVIIVDKERRLLGLFTLGDMRHYFLNNGKLTALIKEAMNPTPVVFKSVFDAKNSKQRMVIYPVVNDEGIVVDVLASRKEERESKALANIPVVIMAGGKGTRLYPYTKILPKALIPIGEYTITERIISSFREYGSTDYYMILNHKAGMIKAYFDELEKDYTITFVKEKKFLGTGGGLAYLKGIVKDTFFLSNCDIVVNADLECIYKTHKQQKNKITFVCAMKEMVIPYGIVETNENGNIIEIKEKPSFSFFTNTGLYVIEPEVVEELEGEEFIHVPEIAQRYIERGENVGVFPISERAWMDMGQFDEMESMLERLGIRE